MNIFPTFVWRRRALALVIAAITVLSVFSAGAAAAAGDANGAVYTLSNQVGGNAVLIFERGVDGSLTAAGSAPTGGLGTGSGLDSQGALVLSQDGQRLFAVNGGSDDISVFDVDNDGLTLVERAPSGGVRPISVTVDGDVLYVLNAGSGNISGFRVANDGTLSPIPGSTQPLTSAAADPAQISFTPDGEQLVVTEKATNLILTFDVEDGVAAAPVSHASSGITPFGFGFGHRNTLIVSEAFGGAPNGSAVSSYRVSSDGDVDVISASAATTETSACWIVVTNDGRFTYTTNAASGTISGYRVAPDGTLTLLDADGVTGNLGASGAIDMALSRDSRFLFAVASGSHEITSFAVGSDGSLTQVDDIDGLPVGASGLAAR